MLIRFLIFCMLIVLIPLTADASLLLNHWKIKPPEVLIGGIEKFQWDFVSATGDVGRLGFYSDGRIGIGSTIPSDGASVGGRTLAMDIDGSSGAMAYCDTDGNNCLTSTELGRGISIIADNTAWPGTPTDGEKVYNRDAHSTQYYDSAAHGGAGGWQPTYTHYMAQTEAQIAALSPSPETGDQIYSSDCGLILTYNGTHWIDLSNNYRNLSNCGITAGTFTFDCGTNPTATGTFVVGASSTGKISVPISSPSIGKVVLEVLDNGFEAIQTFVIQGGETNIDIQRLNYNGSGTASTMDFEITAIQGTGSCTGEATVTN